MGVVTASATPDSASAGEASLTWRDDGLCAQTDPEAFFPERGSSPKPAKRVCQACPVRTECLEYALERSIRFGVWGGLTERERRWLRAKRED